MCRRLGRQRVPGERMLMLLQSSQTSFTSVWCWYKLQTSFPTEKLSWEMGGGIGPGIMFC